MSSEREKALRDCTAEAGKLRQHTWGDRQIQKYRSCMMQHGQQQEYARQQPSRDGGESSERISSEQTSSLLGPGLAPGLFLVCRVLNDSLEVKVLYPA
jgi:hypothetical protein